MSFPSATAVSAPLGPRGVLELHMWWPLFSQGSRAAFIFFAKAHDYKDCFIYNHVIHKWDQIKIETWQYQGIIRVQLPWMYTWKTSQHGQLRITQYLRPPFKAGLASQSCCNAVMMTSRSSVEAWEQRKKTKKNNFTFWLVVSNQKI